MEQKLPFKQSMSRLEEIIAALEKNEIEHGGCHRSV